MKNRGICIHAHFYQPPRENPWLEEVELEDSAYPHHDWNSRITSECYAPNMAARTLGPDRRIVDIINNYAKISFNIGPTLFSWLERHEPETYRAIIESDRLGQERFSGHGTAIAQVYNHMIMPLANARDKRTQVVWGVRDFEVRFGRKPEGMWLAETAVDLPTLEDLAEQGISFTILAPHQAGKFRAIGTKSWTDVSGGRIDTTRSYLCKLPSGREIALFFYAGNIAHDVAFGDLLKNGENFARRLLGGFGTTADPQLVHIATDGETFGHHHQYGDMALAYCLREIEKSHQADITIYGEFLEKYPPAHEVEIVENTSWSCAHGIERWRSDCGCHIGGEASWTQAWRAPLRMAMDWLRDELVQLYEERMHAFGVDPWAVRDASIEIILHRTDATVQEFIQRHCPTELSPEQRVHFLKLLEMQRHAMLMYTSCGWFFDDVSGIESVQVMKYAGRALQLAREVSNVDLEPAFLERLAHAPSNLVAHRDAAHVYEESVRPIVLDFLRLGAHYGVSSLFEEYPSQTKIYCYTAESLQYERIELGRQRLAIGRTKMRSDVVGDEAHVSFAVLHLGDHNLLGGVRYTLDDASYLKMQQELKDAFLKRDISEVITAMDRHLGTHSYSLLHLFKDEQRKVLSQVVMSALREAEGAFRHLYEHHSPVMNVMREMRHPLPPPLAMTMELMLNTDLRAALEALEIDMPELSRLIEETRKWPIDLDRRTLEYVGSEALGRLIDRFQENPHDLERLRHAVSFLDAFRDVSLSFNLWKSQNAYFRMNKQVVPGMQAQALEGVEMAKIWLENFRTLGDYLQMAHA